MIRSHRWLVAAASGVLGLVGLALGAVGAGAATSQVSIINLAYAPATLTVPAGTQVTWTNNDSGGTPHTVTADSGAFDSSPACPATISACLAPGGSFSHTFATAGTFAYHCKVHTFMHGQVVVTAAISPSPSPLPTSSPSPSPVRTASPNPTVVRTSPPAPTATRSPAVVAGVSASRPGSSAPAALATLPKTGASNQGPLLLAAGALIVVGSAVVVAARHRRPGQLGRGGH